MHIKHIHLLILYLLLIPVVIAESQTLSVTNSSITQILDAIKNNTISCEQLIMLHLDRIKQFNLTTTNNLAPINAITEINTRSLAVARQKDLLVRNSHGSIQGKLFCVPVIVKDNIDVQGMTTTSGSYALLGTKALKNAALVDQLEKENAIIIAKSSMDELAMGITGISSRSGRIGNAYNPAQNPGGSSGGSAAAIAANFAVLGIGTDNSGSVRIPAAYNGLYGIRPTQGLINKSGIFPMGNIDGTPGPMTRNVTDLAIALEVLVTHNQHNSKNYSSYLNKESLAGKKIAVIHGVGKYDVWNNMPRQIHQIYQQAIDNMIKSGAVITELDLPDFNNDRSNNMAGTVEDVNNYLELNLATRANMDEICTSNRTRVVGNISECLKIIAKTPPKNSLKYNEALNNIKQNAKYVTTIMQQQRLDGLLMPIGTTGSSTYEVKTVNTWQAPIASNSGLPSIVVQIGQDPNKMPVALEIIGTQFSEGKLLGMAYAYEQHFTKFTPPKLIADTQFNQWSNIRLNNLYSQIGKIAYQTILSKEDSNKISAHQSNQITVQAIRSLKE